ncbi:hypothetical protein BDU57DRAFT_531051 [Ampelomyces quisqualis]|uniref:Uncharacterized protein n=1 Tax=Ampelomyces quisqualis TaxID=50730 RepID=A0A6A5QFV0_AMPQU|nr:hypothetical protein BDU57DRAFT_531051 [Ampelomyces quisqualis]
MPFPFIRQTRSKPNSFAPYDNPWAPARPVSPTDQLRRSFRSFTHLENMRRAERNEQPLCTPQGRDRAFEKLMRLSRGEGVYHWAIEKCDDDGDDEVHLWRGDWEEAQMEMEMERIENLEREREARVTEGNKAKTKAEEVHERKDSKDVVVVVKTDDAWRTTGHRVLAVQGTHVGDGPEYIEDIAEKK